MAETNIDAAIADAMIRVTEAAAIAAHQLTGRGDEMKADQAAVDAMRTGMPISSSDKHGSPDVTARPLWFTRQPINVARNRPNLPDTRPRNPSPNLSPRKYDRTCTCNSRTAADKADDEPPLLRRRLMRSLQRNTDNNARVMAWW